MTGAGSINAAEVALSTVAAQAAGFDPTLGNILRNVVNIASGKGSITKLNLQSAQLTTNISPGDKVRAMARVKCTGLAGFCGASVAFAYTPDLVTTYSGGALVPNNTNGFNWGQDDQTLTLISREFIVPNDTQSAPHSWVNLTSWHDATGAVAATGTLDWTDVRLEKVA
jgi:hypothetical protein